MPWAKPRWNACNAKNCEKVLRKPTFISQKHLFFLFSRKHQATRNLTIALGLLLASSKTTSALSAKATTLGFLLKQQRHLIFLPEATTTFDFSAEATTTFDFSAEATTTFDFSDRSNNNI